MKRHRIAVIQTVTWYGVPIKRYAIQQRVALFWWVTIEQTDRLCQARYYLANSTGKPEKVLKVIE